MTDLFKDEKYEEFDEITQMIEPFESSINEEISQFPEEYELSAKFIADMLINNYSSYYGSSLDIRTIVRRVCADLKLENLARRVDDREFCKTFFKLESTGENITFDLETKALTGSFRLIKIKNGFEDTEIENELKRFLASSFNTHLRKASAVNKGRINEILDLFSCYDGLSKRSSHEKVKALYETYIKHLEDRSLNIKDVELFKRFCHWNVKYIIDGTLPALSNITKVKIMMRSGLPIYSIKEDIV